MQLTDQAVGALMMTLQKCLMEQSDIVPILKGLNFEPTDGGLAVINPPLVKFDEEFEDRHSDAVKDLTATD